MKKENQNKLIRNIDNDAIKKMNIICNFEKLTQAQLLKKLIDEKYKKISNDYINELKEMIG